MKEEKILKLFKNFVGEEVNISGLQCIPVGVGEYGSDGSWDPNPFSPIHFKIKNPNNVSYFYAIVYEELLELLEEFTQYINIRLRPNIIWEDAQPKFYLNDETRNKIQKVFDSVRKIEFTTGTPFIGYKRYVIEINSIGFNNKHFDLESFYIENKVVSISATKNGENVDVSEAIYQYKDEFLPKVETYYESEEYYKKIDEIITKHPLLNADYIVTYYDTKFIQ
jgi:hypothetical protein